MSENIAYPVTQRHWILIASMLAMFMAAIEVTIVATAMPTIIAELGGFSQFGWVFSIYLLTQAVSVPIYGRLADLWGRKSGRGSRAGCPASGAWRRSLAR